MAVEGNIILEKAREEKDVVTLQHRHQTARVTENNAIETPRASSVSTPRSSVPSSVKSTPARNGLAEKPNKYVSPMAKAREEKKRREQAAAASSTTSSSDMETSSNPSTESGMSEKSEDKLGNLPKFGEWDKHSANSGPCYTLLFQNAAQEKKIGGPIRVHASGPSDLPAQNEDLYGYNRVAASVKKSSSKKKQYSLLCCFKSSESS